MRLGVLFCTHLLGLVFLRERRPDVCIKVANAAQGSVALGRLEVIGGVQPCKGWAGPSEQRELSFHLDKLLFPT